MDKSVFLDNIYFGIVLTVAGYLCGSMLKKKFKHPLLNPLLIGIIIAIVVLKVFDIDYEFYNKGAQGLSAMITPCTVCLAVPLYRQLEVLKKDYKAIIAGCVSGVIASLVCILGMSALFGLSHTIYVSLLPKSITTAIGMGVADELGGLSNLTVGAIILTGLLGNMTAVFVLKLFKIEEPAAQGLAIGAASHALGTAKALEMGEVQGAMSSLAISVCGLLTVLGASVFSLFY